MVVHEPASLPYAGDWKGHEQLKELFLAMHNARAEINVKNIHTTLTGNLLLMKCTLIATARKSGQSIRQPFAEAPIIKDGLVYDGLPFYFDTVTIRDALA